MNKTQRDRIVKKVKELLKEGKERSQNTYVEQQEFAHIYKAQDYLVKSCFEDENDVELQTTFGELIPESSILQNRKSGVLKKIRSKDPSVRKTAASDILGEVSGELGMRIQIWVRHPLATESLINALTSETDPKIQCLIINSLACIYERLFADPRMHRPLLDLYLSQSKDVKHYAIASTQSMPIEGKWDYLVTLFENCKTQKMMRSLVGHAKTAPTEIKDDLIKALYRFFVESKKINRETEYKVLQGICRLLDEKNLKLFKADFGKDEQFLRRMEDLEWGYPIVTKLLA